MSQHIAIVEDEPAIRENYADAFRRAGYRVSGFASRREALDAFGARLPDLVIIDVSLGSEPEGGFELCRELRSRAPRLPLIFLTARDSDFDAVSGLRLGADDYLTKDISLPHLLARVAALFRRLQALTEPATARASSSAASCGWTPSGSRRAGTTGSRADPDRVLDRARAGEASGAREEPPAADGCGARGARRRHHHLAREAHPAQVRAARPRLRRHPDGVRARLSLAGRRRFMRLAGQLLAVSAVTLLLPWAGCQYAREIETALRDGEEQALVSTARLLGAALAPAAAEFAPSRSAGRGARAQAWTFYVHALARRRRWTASWRTGDWIGRPWSASAAWRCSPARRGAFVHLFVTSAWRCHAGGPARCGAAGRSSSRSRRRAGHGLAPGE
jgi:CheY-like chemotaxis protein